jgi:hypothetical protein
MLSTVDIAIILASILLVVGVGAFAGRKKADTAHGYFLGGNKLPWWLIGTAFIDAFRIARPDVIFCHWHEDYNPNHSISGMIVDECVHMVTVPNIKTASPPTDKIPHVYFMDTPAGVNFVPEICGAIRTNCGYLSGLQVGAWNFGQGRFIVNTLRIRENLGADPTAERLLRNLLNYASRDTDKSVADLPKDFEIQLKAIGY